MKLFELKDYELQVNEAAWGLEPFKKILKRDKTKTKATALKEMLFIYYYTDIRSDYVVTPKDQRAEEIRKDVGLPEKWKIDSTIQAAIDFYNKRSKTAIELLYESSVKSATDIANYLSKTDELLKERDKHEKPTHDISKITTSLQRIPKLMKDLKDAYKEVVKEQEDLEGRKKGSRTFNTFEQGLDYEVE